MFNAVCPTPATTLQSHQSCHVADGSSCIPTPSPSPWQVGSAYAPSAWRAIREHLADILGKQCLELGDTPGALQHTGQLLLLAAQAGRPAAVQAQHWEQYKGLMKRVAAQQVKGEGVHVCGGDHGGGGADRCGLNGQQVPLHALSAHHTLCNMWCY
jgi:hypothetical protein